ncbi:MULTISPECIES: inositol monophosphatase family protein [Paenibacillus]|uniref:Inositol-1-monophosphatase n=1 Tax=Paenibacillus odorifer TaxID=189426 RepID=A0A1R0YAN2_9BACL|nr:MULTISPECIES: inositol monophosphatase family protein [Paenibacillus]AIQ33708.1 myo-inositol-1-monophosphatase [Paenibacillus sp. FSL R5-0345]OMD44416.1 inositol monophosphatase [Paenibacillus odorifer]
MSPLKPEGKNEREPYVVSSKGHTAVAINAAAKAGEWIKSRQGLVKELNTKTSAQDLVTEVDKGVEQMIRRLILTHFPDHAILGEEGVSPGAAAATAALEEAREHEYLWIVDPVDGTTNFVHGFPFYCVSIALVIRGELTVGVIYDPIRDEMFVAEKGKGAYMHGVPTAVSTENVFGDSLIAMGFPPDREFAQPVNMAGLQSVLPQIRGIRAGGSAALHLAYVAAGRVDGYWEVGLSPWDCAAGVLLVLESGGRITDTLGRPYDIGTRHLVASNGHIHEYLVSSLKNAEATGYKL